MARPTREMMADQGDQQLVRQACAGDARAFQALVERHYDRIFRMAFKWCRNQSDTEKHTGSLTYDDVIATAQGAKGTDELGYRAEFIQLVRLAKSASALQP